MDGYELKQDRKKSHSQPLKRPKSLKQVPLKPKAKEMEDIENSYWRNRINKKDRRLASYEMEL